MSPGRKTRSAKSRRQKKTAGSYRSRVLGLSLIFVASLYVARAIQLQIVQGEDWRSQATAQSAAHETVPAVRGQILDRNGRPLAVSVNQYEAYYAPTEAVDRDRTVTILARLLNLPADKEAGLRSATTGWHLLSADVTERGREAILDRLPRGVNFAHRPARVYPEGRLARAILGSVDAEGRGAWGMELMLDAELQGVPGETLSQRDARGERYRHPNAPIKQAVPGKNVYLTIDVELQAIAEEALERTLQETGSSGGDIVLLDPETGELLAVASRRPGASGTVPAFTDPYEPGSTMKPFLLTALLEEGVADLGDKVFVENGTWRTGNRVISDVHGYDTLTVADVIRFSSNIGAAKLSSRLERGMQYRFLRDFGLGTPTGIEYPSESAGLLRRPNRWSGLSQASLAIGYELMVTSVQLVAAYGALANDGVLLRPGLVYEIRSAEGERSWRRDVSVVRRVASDPVMAQVSAVLSAVVAEGGTGQNAALATLAMAGKTGTARISSAGNYAERRYRASFAGFVPVDDPKLVILTMLEDPQGRFYGGGTAAPVSRKVMEAALVTRGADMMGSRLVDSQRAGRTQALSPNLRSPFLLVDSRSPGGETSSRTSFDRDAGDIRLPNLRGLPTRTATARLHELGLKVELQARGEVRDQSPAAGVRIVPGATVLLR